MNRRGLVIGLFAETHLHPGTGRTTGTVDLPVAREATTDYPTIPGSSLKGALKERAETENWEMVDALFGKPDSAGAVSFTDARLLLLPVRSLTSHYLWVTCRYILERLERDLRLVGLDCSIPWQDLPEIGEEQALGNQEGKVFLEELNFSVHPHPTVTQVAKTIAPLIPHESAQRRLDRQLLILRDDDFKYFAQYGLAVVARNQLDNKTKQSQNLWYEEALAPDTVLYTLAIPRPGQETLLVELARRLLSPPYLQVGGNETVGQGWCCLTVLGAEGVAA